MLKLTGTVHVAPDAHKLFDDLGSALVGAAQKAIEERGVFHLALSGGGTPEPFYMSLVTDPRYRLFPWQQTHVWIVDERRVPEDDEKSNIKMIRESLLSQVPLRDGCEHPMPVLADDPALDYEAALSAAFDGMVHPEVPKLDFVLLGMGGDAHTASLFPQSPALGVTDRWIACNDGERVVPPPRVTMTYPLINHAREVAVLLVGSGKHATLKQIEAQLAKGTPDIQELPITGINPAPHGGEMTWFLDHGAANG
ncbi:MAG: 6-phosphogluconolactonase [Phycisphaerales bacterium JB063]